MIYSAEYIIKVKIDKIFMPPGHNEEELIEEVQSKGRDDLRKFFRGDLLDPDKKVIFETIHSELIKP